MPGFIDAHVHFGGYAAHQHDIQRVNVDDDE
jgi:imidazolonepropionase-like amidohydrolase